MSKKIGSILFSILLLTLPSWGQTGIIDSLEKRLESTSQPEERLEILLELAGRNLRKAPDQSIQYAQEALDLAKANDLPFYEGKALISKGIYHEYQSQNDSPLIFFQQASEIFEELGDSSNYYQSIFEKAIFHTYGSNYLLATKYYLSSLAYFERQKDTFKIAKVLNNLGVMSLDFESYEEAALYLKRSYNLKQSSAPKARLASTLNNLSFALYFLGELDSSISYALQSLEFQEEDNLWSFHTSHRNLGAAYLKQEKYSQALFHTQKALSTIRELGGVPNIAGTLLELSQIKLGQNRLNAALTHINEARQLIDSIALYNLLRSDILNHQTKVSLALGNQKEAIKYLQENLEIRDSIFQKEKIAEISRIKTLYETEKQEQELKILRKDQELQRTKLAQTRQRLFSLLALCILLGAIALALILLGQQRKKNSLLLKENNDFLVELNKTKDQLFSIIAHDLKSPLSAFRSLTTKLEKKWSFLEKEDIFPFIQSLNDSSNHLYELLQNLLEWAVAQAGKIKPNIKAIETSTLIHSVIDPFYQLIQLKEQQVSVRLDGPTSIYSDEHILQTVLRNLIANAIKFTDEGGSIVVRTEMEEDLMRIHVEDNGMGISQEDQQKLFRLEESTLEIGDSPEKGSGLGLVLCKELIEKIGGDIQLESEIGQGSIFSIKFPYTKESLLRKVNL